MLLLRLVPAALRERCFQSPLPAARAARRSRRRRQRLTILAPYNGEPWRIDGSVERARTPLAASTRHTASAHRSPTHTAEHTWTEDRQPPKTVVRHGGGLVRRTPDITPRYNSVCFAGRAHQARDLSKTRYIYGWYLYVTSLRFVRTGVMKVMWVQVNHKTQPFWIKVVHLVTNFQSRWHHPIGSNNYPPY